MVDDIFLFKKNKPPFFSNGEEHQDKANSFVYSLGN